MPQGRPLAPLSISAEDRLQLESWSRRPKTTQAVAMRSRIVLLAAEGLRNTAIAARLHTLQHTAGKWRRRCLESGLDGLLDEPRPGTGRRLIDEDVERVLTLTLESTPTDATHWSTRSMAKRSGLSRNSIHRIWQAFSLAPHRSETFKLSRDPLFIDKVCDVVGLYLAAPERALVLCVDEKSQIQALDRTATLLPMRPGQVERRSHDYARHGTTTLFAALDAQSGELIGQMQRRHRSVEFRAFLGTVSRHRSRASSAARALQWPRWQKRNSSRSSLAGSPLVSEISQSCRNRLATAMFARRRLPYSSA
jgi:transposase